MKCLSLSPSVIISVSRSSTYCYQLAPHEAATCSPRPRPDLPRLLVLLQQPLDSRLSGKANRLIAS